MHYSGIGFVDALESKISLVCKKFNFDQFLFWTYLLQNLSAISFEWVVTDIYFFHRVVGLIIKFPDWHRHVSAMAFGRWGILAVQFDIHGTYFCF